MEVAVREEQPAEEPAAAAAAPVAAVLGPARVLALQRLAGNRAVTRVLARQFTLTAEAERELDAQWHVDWPSIDKDGSVGAAMFMDPAGTGKLLRDDFDTVWLPKALK